MVLKVKRGFKSQVGRVRGSGSIVCRHKGGGVKRVYFLVDQFRFLYDSPAIVCKLFYNPFTNSLFGLVLYTAGFYSFIPLSNTTRVGDVVFNFKSFSFSQKLLDEIESSSKDSSFISLKYLKDNTYISYLEDYPFQGSVYGKSYGTTVKLLRQLGENYSLVRLPSGELKIFYSNCRCIPNQLGKSLFFRFKKDLAGVSRRLGIRPTVRGVAMNPVDHPHGGGEGKSSGGRPSTSPWGWLTKGPKTGSKKRYTKFRVVVLKSS